MGVAAKINSVAKFVVSTTLQQADWENTTNRQRRCHVGCEETKRSAETEIQIEGSAALVHSLMAEGLIDEFRFLVHPVIAGKAKTFF